MEIEIYKTKTKLTKSIINQMTICSVYEFIDGNVLGYVVNVAKNSFRSFIVEFNENYYTFSCRWNKSKSGAYRMNGKWTYQLDLKDNELAEEFWRKLNIAIKESEQIYI